MHDEVVHYRDNGFVVIEDFLDPTELDDWRNAVDEAVLLRGKDKVPWGEEDWPESAIFKQIMQLWMDNERMKALLHDERIGRMAADLAGVDGVRIWHDQALIKMPWANPTSWHQDDRSSPPHLTSSVCIVTRCNGTKSDNNDIPIQHRWVSFAVQASRDNG